MYESLKAVRIRENMTCEDMSELIGLKTRSAYHKKETGAVPFSLEEAYIISRHFKKPIEKIFFTR